MKHVYALLGSFLFILSSLSAQIIFSEDFNATTGTSLPAGWTQSSAATDGGFKSGTHSTLSSQYMTFSEGSGRFVGTNDDICNCDKSNDLLKSPIISLDTNLNALFLSVDVFYYNGSNEGKQEKASIEISTDSGITWQVLIQLGRTAGWQPMVFNLANFIGNDNIMLGFRYQDGSGWVYGLGIDNVLLYIPPANEVRLTRFQLPEYMPIGQPEIKATILNLGNDTLRSLTVKYSLNGDNDSIAVVSDLNIAPLASAEISHPKLWQINTPGNYTISFEVSMPNGSPDTDSSNNSGSASTIIATQTVNRVTLVEEFASSTCIPCANYNQILIPVLMEDFRANTKNSRVASLVYHMNFPAPGNDPSYNSDADTRAISYNIDQTPTVFADGAEFYFNPRNIIQNAIQKVAPMKLEIETIFLNDSLITEVTLTPYISKPAGLKLFIALTEDYCDYKGYNKEVDFIYVMRKLLPGPLGKSLPALIPDQPLTFRYAFKVNAGNVTKGSFNFWSNDLYNYTSIAWVQDLNGSRHVYQAAFDESITVGLNEIANLLPAKFSPNPTNGVLHIKTELSGKEHAQLNVFNMTGQLVHSQSIKTPNAGNQLLQVDLSQLHSGAYLVELSSEGKRAVNKISIIR